MSLEEALYTYLVAQQDVVALVGTRIYPEAAPTDAVMPYCTYTQAADRPEYHLGGVVRMTTAQVTLDIWAGTWQQRRRVADALQSAIEAWVATQPVLHGVTVRYAGLADAQDEVIAPTEGSEQVVYHRAMAATVLYRR